MAVDITQYRAAIGSFISRNISHKCLKPKREKKSRETNSLFSWVKLILIASLVVSWAELNNLNQTSTNINRVAATEKHNLSCLSYDSGGNVLRLKQLNVSQTFVKTESADGVLYYKFSNLNNKYNKYTNGNRKQGGIRIFHFNKANSH